ncbi:hypothetical protein [Niabella ginsengisoli]|uniref:Uncharacterized protein n=1 Tax=Niabella ginsengisoli TaxID=522298 RepID=A0ABS9SMV4_9BACT|nr:hypothetical protein [Niabella ginsengisoli]MCH5599702.1 hypothetical protein [Niabella ginsengisoli]
MYQQKKHSIAIVTFLCPYPVSDGGRFGVFSFVNDIRNFFDVTLVFKVPRSEEQNVTELKKLWPDVDVQPVYTNNSIKSNAVEQKVPLYKKLVLPIRILKYKRRAKKETFQKRLSMDYTRLFQQSESFWIFWINYSVEKV